MFHLFCLVFTSLLDIFATSRALLSASGAVSLMSREFASKDRSFTVRACDRLILTLMVLHLISSCAEGAVGTGLFCVLFSVMTLPLTDTQEVPAGAAVEVAFAVDFVESEGLRRDRVATV